jgi:hypothetical protein
LEVGNAIQKYSQEATKNISKELRERCTTKCNDIKNSWKRVEIFVRAKPTIVQKAISAQLRIHKKGLIQIEEEEFQNEKNEYQQDEEQSEDEDDSPPDPNQVFTVRLCIGQRCHLKQWSNPKNTKTQTPKHLIWSKASRVLPNVSIKGWGKISVFVFLGLLQCPKHFNSKGTKTRTGPKKCPSCKVFEPALKKTLQIEEYLIGQLKNTTKDDMFQLLYGLSSLMMDSKSGKIKKTRFTMSICSKFPK